MSKIYVPFLQASKAPFTALELLNKEVLKRVKPAFILPEPEPSKSEKKIEEGLPLFDTVSYCKGRVNSILEVSKQSNNCYIDTSFLYKKMNQTVNCFDGLNFPNAIFEYLDNADIEADIILDYQFISQIFLDLYNCKMLKLDICLKIGYGHLLNSILHEKDQSVIETLKSLVVESKKKEIIIDLGRVHSSFGNIDDLRKVLSNLIYLGFKTIIISGSSYPLTSESLPKNSTSFKERFIWSLFLRIQKEFNNVIFSDYALMDYDSVIKTINQNTIIPRIKYAVNDQYIFFSGEKKMKGVDQLPGLCKRLVTSHYYCGASFSHGDKEYQEISEGKDYSKGSHEMNKRALNHYITLVDTQLQKLF